MKLTKEEALAYLDRLIVAQEIIEEEHQVGEEDFIIASHYSSMIDDDGIMVHNLALLAEIAGLPLTLEDWGMPGYKIVKTEHGGRTFSDLKRVGKIE